MKSLEALKNIKREAGVPYFSTLYDIDMWKEDFETIKQDLEALEIIRKKNVDIKFLKFNIEGFIEGAYETIEVSLWAYNLRQKDDEKLTMEELLKLKQWLEENKDEKE